MTEVTAIAKIMLGEDEVPSASYAVDGDELTVKKEALSAIENGENSFLIHGSNGDTATLTITVAD